MCISWWSGPGRRAPACRNAHSSDLDLSREEVLFQCIMAVSSSYPMWHYTPIHHIGIVAESFIWTNILKSILNHSHDYDGLQGKGNSSDMTNVPNQLIVNWLRDFTGRTWPNQVALKREKIQLLSGRYLSWWLGRKQTAMPWTSLVGSWGWVYVARTWECSPGAVSEPCLTASEKRRTSVLQPKGPEFVNSPNNLRKNPPSSRWEYVPTTTLTSALWDPDQRNQLGHA